MKSVSAQFLHDPSDVALPREFVTQPCDMHCPQAQTGRDVQSDQFWRSSCKLRVRRGGGCDTFICAEGDVTRAMLNIIPPQFRFKEPVVAAPKEPAKRPCEFNGCPSMIGPNNQSGYCRKHRYYFVGRLKWEAIRQTASEY